jgi:hypothetical protein
MNVPECEKIIGDSRLTNRRTEEIRQVHRCSPPRLHKRGSTRDIWWYILKPKIWYTPEGKEVWYYKSPQEQNIYFTDGIVDWVEYNPKVKQKLQPEIRQFEI